MANEPNTFHPIALRSRTKNRGPGRLDMSEDLERGDADAAICDRLLEALYEHHKPGAGEGVIASYRSVPARFQPNPVFTTSGSTSQMCVDAAGPL